MKTINKTIDIKIILILIFFISCNSEEELEEVILLDPVITNQIVNFAAPQTGGMGQPIGGEFSKFDFKTGMKTTSETDWDIAFRGTTIAVNGGAATGTADEPVRNGNAGASIVSGLFAEVTNADNLTTRYLFVERSKLLVDLLIILACP